MRRKLHLILPAAIVLVGLALIPAVAEAQRSTGRPSGGGARAAAPAPPQSARPAAPPPAQAGHAQAGRPGPGGHPGGGTVVVRGGYYGGYYGYPYWGFGWGWGPYWGGWYGPWGYPYWGGPYYDYVGPELRLEVKPKDAEVYVDGYYVGIVDDFDGTFQRLRVQAGEHELVLYREGYQTVRQNVKIGQRQDAKIKFQMVPLAAGQTSEPPPQPTNPPPSEPAAGYQVIPDQPVGQQRRPAPSGVGVEAQGFGSVVFRVQPSGAEVLIDGERWQGPEGSERLVVQVAAGSHRIEVRKEGYAPFSTTIQVRAGETLPLNVSLPPRGE